MKFKWHTVYESFVNAVKWYIEIGGGDWRAHISSYKKNKSQICKGQHREYSQSHCKTLCGDGN